MSNMGRRTTLLGLLKAAALGLTVALLTYYGLLAYLWWGRTLPIPVQIITLAAGGSLFMTFGHAVIFSADTRQSMRRAPILILFGRCFLPFVLLLTSKIVADRFL